MDSDPNQFCLILQTHLQSPNCGSGLRNGEHLLDIGDIRVSNNALVVILILVEVHSGPHTRIPTLLC